MSCHASLMPAGTHTISPYTTPPSHSCTTIPYAHHHPVRVPPKYCRTGSEADDLVPALVGAPPTFRLSNQGTHKIVRFANALQPPGSDNDYTLPRHQVLNW